MKASYPLSVVAMFAVGALALAQGCSNSDGEKPAPLEDASGYGGSASGAHAGGSAGAGATSGKGGGGAATTTTASAACSGSCTKLTANCVGVHEQYSSMDTCLGYCADLPLGAKDDMSGNTAWCRDYHAGAAAKDPVLHCAHAGPAGVGHCGTSCESFCSVALKACPSAFESEATCKAECAAFPGADATDYNDSDKTNNTFACRMYHLNAAITAPSPHCGHIGTISPTCAK